MATPQSATRIPYDATRHRLTRSGKWQDRETLRFVALDKSTVPQELAAPRAAPELPRPLAEGPGRDLGPAPLPPSAPPAPVPSAPGPVATRPLEAGAPAAPAAPVGAFDALPDASAPQQAAPVALPGVGLVAPGGHLPGCWKASSEGAACPCCGELVFPRPAAESVQAGVGLYEHAINAVAARRGGTPKPFTVDERATVTELMRDVAQRYGASGGKHAPAIVLALTTFALVSDRAAPTGAE